MGSEICRRQGGRMYWGRAMDNQNPNREAKGLLIGLVAGAVMWAIIGLILYLLLG